MQKVKTRWFEHFIPGVPILFSWFAIGLAVSAVFLPWFRWSQHTRLVDGQGWLNTTNLNYLLPSLAVGTQEAMGAQTEDGHRALAVGHTARWIVLGISALGFSQLLRERVGVDQLLIPVLMLFVFLCLFGYVALNNLLVDLVMLEDEKTLPYILGLEWTGPASLTGALLLQILALLIPRTRVPPNRI